MALPENGDQLVVGGLRRIEHDQHDLGVAGATRAHLLVGRIRREAAGVADRRRVDAVHIPEFPLRTPETTHPEYRQLQPLRERRSERGAQHEMALGNGHRGLTAAKRLLGLHQLCLAAKPAHHCSFLLVTSSTTSCRGSFQPGERDVTSPETPTQARGTPACLRRAARRSGGSRSRRRRLRRRPKRLVSCCRRDSLPPRRCRVHSS